MCVSFRALWSFHRWFYWASQLHTGGFGFYEEFNFSVCFSLFVSVALPCFKCNYSVTGLSCVWRSMNRCWFSGEGIQKMRAFRNALWFLKYSEVTKSQNKTFTSLGLNVRNPPIFNASEPFQRTLHACMSFVRQVVLGKINWWNEISKMTIVSDLHCFQSRAILVSKHLVPRIVFDFVKRAHCMSRLRDHFIEREKVSLRNT